MVQIGAFVLWWREAIAVKRCPLLAQPEPLRRVTWIKLLNGRPEFWAVVHMCQMRHLMGHDIIAHSFGCHDQAP